MTDSLPSEILDAPKRGFNVPVSAWFRGDVSGFAREVLTSPTARRRGLIDTTAVGPLLDRHADRQGNLGSTIWSLLIFELWCLAYLDQSGA
jgi:asparagine synthase (glutamine-hydrolysing)